MNRQIRLTALGLILLFGFALRCYNLDFPSIGYHSMQENEYLSIAQEMIRTGDFITRRIYFYDVFGDNPQARIYNQPALISYQTIVSWRLLGENLWAPRLFNILFGVLSIPIIYLISNLLFNNVYLSLFSSLLLAIMPLAVFFSRNLQPESAAFFFMLLGNFFYLRFIYSQRKYNLFLGGLSFSLAWLYRFSFIWGILPFLFCFPLYKIYREKRKFLRRALAFFLPYLVILFAILCSRSVGQWEFKIGLPGATLFEIFTPSYWQKNGLTIWRYIKDENFTAIFAGLACLGIIIAFLKRKRAVNRYIIGWTLTALPYMMLYSEHIYQNNYFQMPFLAMACVSAVYAVLNISEGIKKIFKRGFLLFLIIAITTVSIPFVYRSIQRMHATVFLGVDVAGESLKEFTQPGEYVFLLTHAQGYGIARYARRYVGWTFGVQDFKDKEEKFNIKYICFYPAEYAPTLKTNNPLLFNYIQENYHVKEVGIIEEPRQVVYIILEKGKGSDPKEFLQEFSGPMHLRTIYRIFGRYIFFYSMNP